MNRIILYLLIYLLPLSSFAQWQAISNENKDKTEPLIKVLSDDKNSTVIKINISGFQLNEFTSGNELFQSVDLLSESFVNNPGDPMLPNISSIIAIPDDAEVSYEILETGVQQTFYNINLPPCRKSWFEGKPESEYLKSDKVYSSSEIFPSELVSIGTPGVFRDFRIVRFSVFPIRYIPANQELQVISSITIKINHYSGNSISPKGKSVKSIAPSFAGLYQSFILNYRSALSNLYYGNENGRDVMLCIMPDSYVSTFQPYADWKTQTGTEVHITKFSDIGAVANSATIVKNHITDAYHNWEYPPTYVLLVGDAGVCPRKTVYYDYSFANEDFFVEIDGNDYLPEMMIGRFPVNSTYDLQVLTAKAMNYEKTPYTTSTDWFKKGISCSNNEYASQISTKRYTSNVMIQDGGFTSVDTLMSNSPCTMDLTDVITAINNGRSFLNYRGEGWSDGWWAHCYPFSVSDVSNINNGKKLTFVTSIGCGVAMFDAGGGNCFGEEWLKLGTPSSVRGAIAFVGPTSNTHTQYNNKIDRGIYVGMFREGLETPGQALLRGKLYMYNSYGANDPWMEYQYRVFTVLGDPSVHIWKNIPLAINVNYPLSVPLGYSQNEITVTYASTGMPVENAQVTITGNSVFASAFTDQNGQIILGITTQTLDSLIITVRGDDVIPFQQKIGVNQLNVHVGPLGIPDINGINGNLDNLMSPNEDFDISFTLKDWGVQTASNTMASLTSLDTNLQVLTTTPINYGDITSGNFVTGSPFHIHVNQNSAIGSQVRMNLHVTSGANSWDYLFYHPVDGCKLIYDNNAIVDNATLSPNAELDPGETVNLFLTIRNIGADAAPNVSSILRTNDPYITIHDSIGTFGTVNVNSTGTNTTDYYELSASSSCPIDYIADFTLILTAQGNYNYSTTVSFSLPVGMSDSLDPTGPDTYGYYAYSSDDTLFNQAPVYNWTEISGVGTQINIQSSEYTETVSIPFPFKYYGTNFSNLRINTDGFIAFGSGTETSYNNIALPASEGISSMVAIFWDDLFSDSYFNTQDIYYWHDLANHRFIIEWDSLAHWGEELWPNYEIFQIILNDPAYYTDPPTGDGEIIFQYKNVLNPNSCTVGIENNTEDGALQYVFNNTYQLSASVLKNNFAIKFTTESPTFKTPVYIPDINIINKSGLFTVYPNPFNQNTVINYTLSEQSSVSLKIFDMNGHLVKELFDGSQHAGEYIVDWNGQNSKGIQLNAGMYFVKLVSNNVIQTIKLCKLK